jgi:hypothetical protein
MDPVKDHELNNTTHPANAPATTVLSDIQFKLHSLKNEISAVRSEGIKDFFQSCVAVVLSTFGVKYLTDKDEQKMNLVKKTINVYTEVMANRKALSSQDIQNAKTHLDEIGQVIGSDPTNRAHHALIKEAFKENPFLRCVVQTLEKSAGDEKMTILDIQKIASYLETNVDVPIPLKKLYDDMHGLNLKVTVPSMTEALKTSENEVDRAAADKKSVDLSKKGRADARHLSLVKNHEALKKVASETLTYSERFEAIIAGLEQESGKKLSLGEFVKLQSEVQRIGLRNAGVRRVELNDFAKGTLHLNVDTSVSLLKAKDELKALRQEQEKSSNLYDSQNRLHKLKFGNEATAKPGDFIWKKNTSNDLSQQSKDITDERESIQKLDIIQEKLLNMSIKIESLESKINHLEEKI